MSLYINLKTNNLTDFLSKNILLNKKLFFNDNDKINILLGNC